MSRSIFRPSTCFAAVVLLASCQGFLGIEDWTPRATQGETGGATNDASTSMPSGVIYVWVSQGSMAQGNSQLFALTSGGALKWATKVTGGNAVGAPVVAANGWIYVPSYSRVHAVDSDGVPQVVWTVPEPSISMFSGSVTILADHVGLITGSGSKLYALGP